MPLPLAVIVLTILNAPMTDEDDLLLASVGPSLGFVVLDKTTEGR